MDGLLNTKDVLRFLHSQLTSLSPPEVYKRARKMGFLTTTHMPGYQGGGPYDRNQHTREIIDMIEQEPGKNLPYKEMQKIVTGRKKELVEYLYLAKGDEKEALAINDVGSEGPYATEITLHSRSNNPDHLARSRIKKGDAQEEDYDLDDEFTE